MKFIFALLFLCLFKIVDAEKQLRCTVPVAFVNATKATNSSLWLNQTGIKYVLNALREANSNSVQLVSLQGLARQGKSTTLDMFAEYLFKSEVWESCHDHFKIAHQMNSCTKGLWLWVVPGSLSKTGNNYLLLDTQGLKDITTETDEAGLTRMLAFSVTVSDLAVYMVDKTLNDVDINELAFVGRVATSLLSDAPPNNEQMEKVLFSSSDISRFPYLVGLIGNDESWSRNAASRPFFDSREDVKILDDLLNGDTKSANRSYVNELFPNRSAFVMPSISKKDLTSLTYFTNPVKNKNMRNQINSTYKDRRNAIFARWVQILQELPPRFGNNHEASINNPAHLVDWWEKIASSINEQEITKQTLMEIIVMSVISEEEKRVLDAVYNEYLLLKGNNSLWPIPLPREKEKKYLPPSLTLCLDNKCLKPVLDLSHMDAARVEESKEKMLAEIKKYQLTLLEYNRQQSIQILNIAIAHSIEAVARKFQKNDMIYPVDNSVLQDMEQCGGCRELLLNKASFTESEEELNQYLEIIESEIAQKVTVLKQKPPPFVPKVPTVGDVPGLFTRNIVLETFRLKVGPELTLSGSDVDPLRENVFVGRKIIITDHSWNVSSVSIKVIADELELPSSGWTLNTAGLNGDSFGNRAAVDGSGILRAGEHGKSGGSVTLAAMKVKGGSIHINTSGGNGGSGMVGYTGQPGREGGVCSRGHKGETGGPAGASGNGGDGGPVELFFPPEIKVTVIHSGGIGGAASRGGEGGAGGNGGPSRYATRCKRKGLLRNKKCWEYQVCGTGDQGPPGDRGADATEGKREIRGPIRIINLG